MTEAGRVSLDRVVVALAAVALVGFCLYLARYSASPGLRTVVVLDRWTGTIYECAADARYSVCHQLYPERRPAPSKTD